MNEIQYQAGYLCNSVPIPLPAGAIAEENAVAYADTKRPVLRFIHNFRAVAILLIVSIHCYSILQPGGEPLLVRRGTLLFMFVSGFLFQYLSPKFDRAVYWHKKVTYVLIPYLVVSAPIILVRVLAGSHSQDMVGLLPDFGRYSAPLQIILYYLTGLHLVPFWFIPMICFYYLLAPLFVALDKDRRVYWLLPLLLALSLVVTRATEVYKIHLAFVHYLSIYLLGMFMSHHYHRALAWTDKYWPLLAAVLSGILVVSLAFTHKQVPYLEQFLFVQKLVLCWGLFYGFWKFDPYIPRLLGKVADMSFGFFFLHYYLLFAFSVAAYKGYVQLPPTFLTFCVVFGLDIVFCVGILHVVKKAFGPKSRHFIGY